MKYRWVAHCLLIPISSSVPWCRGCLFDSLGQFANPFCCRWDQGLLDMCIGEKRTLTIPPEYGYGDRGVGPIPGGATLVFETELVAIEGVEKDEL